MKARKSCEHGPENGKEKFNQTRQRSDNGFATKKVKGVNDFPSRANDLENLNKDVKVDGL